MSFEFRVVNHPFWHDSNLFHWRQLLVSPLIIDWVLEYNPSLDSTRRTTQGLLNAITYLVSWPGR
jgi:hypothetical protein